MGSARVCEGVAQALELVLEGGTLGEFAGGEVLDGDAAAGAADARHLAQGHGRIFEVMQGEAAEDDVELAVGKGELLGIGALETNIGETALATGALGDGEDASVMSTPTTSRQRPAIAMATWPGPVAISSARASGAGLMAFTRRSRRSRLCSSATAANASAWRVNSSRMVSLWDMGALSL